jgi:endonuclease YncB( thermonuclease family)
MTAHKSLPNWTHPGTVLRVIDGDTLLISLDLGKYPHRIRVEAPIRIAGLYSPELDDEGGAEAAAHLLRLLERASLTEAPIVTVTTRKPDPRDPYGRIVADVYLDTGQNVALAMIAAGHGTAKPTV